MVGMHRIDRVIVTTKPFYRLVALVRHRKRRIRKKYEKTLFVRPATMAEADGAIKHLRAVHHEGRPFTAKGERSAVREMRKAGHYGARAARR